jgi:hypothetical protein
MAQYAYSPATETIHVGDTVTWTNNDQPPHDVTTTSAPVALHSALLMTGQSWSYTFTVPGTYNYICSVHPYMHATLVVQAAPTPVAAPPPVPAAVAPPAPPVRRTVPATTHAAAPPVVSSSASTVAPAAGSAMPSGMAMPAAAPPAATNTAAAVSPGASLNPLLIVAGLVAGVATLCLLLIGSRPEPEPAESTTD